MEHLKAVLIANRGEIACRLIRAAKSLGIRSVAIYSQVDSESLHALSADEAHLLTGDSRSAYLDGDQIIAIAKKSNAQAIVPGYGFLSENTAFARSVADAGLVFVGPSPEAVESFGLKHMARDLAIAAGVPVVPGSQGLVDTEDAAVAAANGLGYPIMLKATAGGGGMGLLVCADETEVRRNFQTVQSRGASLFKHAGVFLERYFPDSHHIEVQVFGNGQGKAISVGERECSIQRRHQKVVEECPSPLVELKYPELRASLTACAVRLAESIRYGSAGTVEYLVDDETGDFFFLEMNTRLQVEHGITEMCYGVDLVELMLRQADAELAGRGGLEAAELERLQPSFLSPTGHAIEVRVYAENPARDFSPSPGLLQEVVWHQPAGARVDTWVQTGMTVTADYDPLLAKLMYHGATRDAAVAGMEDMLRKSVVHGPPANLDFLLAIVQDATFRRGHTNTKFLSTFAFVPAAIDVLSGGSYTLIQDYPGRPTVGHGFGHAGPMDTIAFRAANILAGNPEGTEGLEITLTGPDLRFLGDAVVALCGPPIPAHLDGAEFPQWTRVHIRAGQRLTLGKMAAHCRVYLAVYGGFLNVASWFGSKSTNPMVNVGGYQGRPLRAGDFLRIVEPDHLPQHTEGAAFSLPKEVVPRYTSDWHIEVMPGPYETGYLATSDIETIYSVPFKVSHNAARGGIRLIGPRPVFARKDGGEGGGHPSNVIEYGYPLGGLNWTGNEGVLFPADCPDFGGFICSFTVTKGDLWKMGQLRAGDSVQFHRVSLDSALQTRRRNEAFLAALAAAVSTAGAAGSAASSSPESALVPFDSDTIGPEAAEPGQDVLRYLEATATRPAVTYRGGADDYVLVEYGTGAPDLNNKCRSTALKRALDAATGPVSTNRAQGGVVFNTVGCVNTLAISYSGLGVSRDALIDRLVALEDTLGDMSAAQFPSRHFRLPLTFKHRKLDDAIERYMANQRSKATYLPDPFKFVAENNGMTVDELKRLCVKMETVVIAVGFFMALPLSLPVDPRDRIRSPKMNPSRTYTPEGTFSYGGSSVSVYPVDSPGGYMLMGMTMPGVDVFGRKRGFAPERPWMFEDMDIVSFYEVTEEEYDAHMAAFHAGRYDFEVTPTVFDMAAHNRLLSTATSEAEALQAKREVAQDAMAERERESLAQWLAEKQAGETSEDEIQALLADPGVEAIEAPVNANVWKVLVEEGDVLKAGQTVVILEAMKMEINVNVESRLAGAKVIKVVIKPGDSIESGAKIILAKEPAN
ncbi:Allophanate hydrolase subunit 2 [Niveomyces insectorum RCEF 264]|uniref:Allophanate hydrolase subunit 2 n=1 Tax=Niveomyces insectorum RCEF 264 TaxID=1081102 RepID=A0A167T794_9HYPO|nr:Allophanate hydrolase subunit 2 [Niveomyces insectorum RCEF 264]